MKVMKEKIAKFTAVTKKPVPWLAIAHCIIVAALWLLTQATEQAYFMAPQMTEAQIAVIIFLTNALPFFSLGMAAIKASEKLYENYVPDKYWDTVGDDETEDISSPSVTIPVKDRIGILILVSLTAVAVAICFYCHNGYSSRLYRHSEFKYTMQFIEEKFYYV